MSAIREAAIALAAKKYRVFPLLPGKKVPTLEKWNEVATTHLEQVEKLFPEVDGEELLSAESNIGIATGNGLLVLDEDPRHGSAASIADLQVEHGALPATRTVITPSGGRHRYFKVPADQRVSNSTSKIGAGLDIRGDGGYVVAPPSVIKDKGTYALETDAPIADAPPWLLEAATKPRTSKESSEQAPETLTAISAAELATVKHALNHPKFREQCAENGTWAEAGYSLLSLGSIGRQLFCEWSRETPGYEVGAPEQWWADHADQMPRADWRHILTMALTCGWKPPGAIAPTDAFSLNETDPGTPPAPLPSRDALDAPGLPAVVFRHLPEDWDTCDIPEQRFVVDDLIPNGRVTLLVSPGGFGKTYLVLYLAICIALGLDFCGHRCKQGRVVLLSGEDSVLTIHRRIRNLWRRHFEKQFAPNAKEKIRENIRIVDLESMRRESGGSTALTKSERGGRASVAPFAAHLADAIGGADFIVVDTASRFSDGDENSNGDAARLIEAGEIVAESADAGVLILAHTGKARGEGQYASRGASAFSDNARSVMVLAPLDPDVIGQLANPGQADRAARNDILRLSHTKSNYAARAEDMHFERHDSGALLPTTLTYAIPTDVDLVSIMLEKIGGAEVNRKQVKDGYRSFFPPNVKREAAEQAFDDAVRDGRLEVARIKGRSTVYRVKQQPAPLGSEGLV